MSAAKVGVAPGKQSSVELEAACARNKASLERLWGQLEQLKSELEPEAVGVLLVGAGLESVVPRLRQELPVAIRYASNGKEGLADFDDTLAEVVVVETGLPDMPAQDFLKEVRRMAGSEALVTIAVSQQKQAKLEPPPPTADSALRLPIEIDDLVDMVKRLFHLPATGAFQVLVQA